MDLGLAGKKALITGGTHGIGLAIAIEFAREGCDIAVCSRTTERLYHVQEVLDPFSIECLTFACDVLWEPDRFEVLDGIKSIWDGVDILINNVGGGGRWGFEDVIKTHSDVWYEVYEKNAGAATTFTLAALPYMLTKNWGRVVTIASIYGKEGGGRPWFNMAKASEISLMKCLAMNKDLVRHHITFNTVAPGAVMVPDTGWQNEENLNEFTESLPLGRMGTPEEVANVVAFLCSEKASLVNGVCIAVDGSESRGF